MAAPEEVAGRYRLDRRLGAGGMSTVFLATDTVLERQVAVKLLAEHLAEDEAFVTRFRREALAVARLQHPNIVQVFDSGEDPDSQRHFIVMEYVDGPSCADLLREHKRLDVEDTVAIVRDACHGLDYAHRAGVIHRDVKPGNLLVGRDSGATKLADFGIAKATEQSRITQVGAVLGTAAYLSPEQARGEEAGAESDIYSLGVCTYQFLTGQLPHEYSSLTELALKQQEESVEPITDLRPEVPAELDRAVRVCLERNPARRYSSALELGQALEAGLQGELTDATQVLGADDHELDATQALPADMTAATQRLRSERMGTRGAAAAAPVPVAAEAPQRRRPDADARKAQRRRRLGGFFTVLAVLLAGAAVALALLSAGSGESTDPVVQDDIERQVDGIKDFLREHSR